MNTVSWGIRAGGEFEKGIQIALGRGGDFEVLRIATLKMGSGFLFFLSSALGESLHAGRILGFHGAFEFRLVDAGHRDGCLMLTRAHAGVLGGFFPAARSGG